MPLPIKFTPKIQSKLDDAKLAKQMKTENKKPKKTGKWIDILERVREDIEKNLGHHKDDYQVITTVEDLDRYIEKANAFGKIAIDTETDSKYANTAKIVGFSMYFPGEKPTYVPINHKNYFDDARFPNQLTEEEAGNCLKKLTAKAIYHNAKFDIRVILHNLHVYIPAWWDTLQCAWLIDENGIHRLKYLHSTLISHKDEQDFNDYFGKIPFMYVPIEMAYLYASHDAIDTYELQEWQEKNHMNETLNPDLCWLFFNIEMPMVDVIVELEENGVAVDFETLNRLKEKYTGELKKAKANCINVMFTEEIRKKIDLYNAQHISKPLPVPCNLNSDKDLAIYFYDIINAPQIKGKKPRQTDKDCLNAWDDMGILAAKQLKAYRAFAKVVSTYITNMASFVSPDGRLHTGFNSIGAVTGRMSSKEPVNLQNIPSKNAEIRNMFCGQTTYRDVDAREDGSYILSRSEEVEMADGTWKWAEALKPGDALAGGEVVKQVFVRDLKVGIRVE